MLRSPHNISVLVSAGRHPVSGAARYARNDAISLSIGLKLAETLGANVEVISASDTFKADNAALADYLALGATEVSVVNTEMGEDIVDSVVQHLRLSKPDIILTGSRAENGEDTGLLPYLIAEKLGLPMIANVLEITPIATGLGGVGDSAALDSTALNSKVLEVLQFLPKGKRRRVVVTLPAVIVIHPLATVKLHYAAAKKTTGKITSLPSSNLPARLNQTRLNPTQILASVTTNSHKPIKLKAQDGQYTAKKTGHERLMAAITTEAKGGAVVIDKSSVEKAQVILRYLREHHLINF